jgi:hypothetical protein
MKTVLVLLTLFSMLSFGMSSAAAADQAETAGATLLTQEGIIAQNIFIEDIYGVFTEAGFMPHPLRDLVRQYVMESYPEIEIIHPSHIHVSYELIGYPSARLVAHEFEDVGKYTLVAFYAYYHINGSLDFTSNTLTILIASERANPLTGRFEDGYLCGIFKGYEVGVNPNPIYPRSYPLSFYMDYMMNDERFAYGLAMPAPASPKTGEGAGILTMAMLAAAVLMAVTASKLKKQNY